METRTQYKEQKTTKKYIFEKSDESQELLFDVIMYNGEWVENVFKNKEK